MDTIRIDRRRFLELGVLGGAASSLGCATAGPAKSGKIPVLLLSCMDYRLIQATERYMDGRGLAKKYDHVILAGASLGAVSAKVPAWNTTFWEHLTVAMRLHSINQVIVLDHRQCGAYNELIAPDCCKERGRETQVHADMLRTLRKQINERHVGLSVELLLMDLDATVEIIT